MSRKTFTLYLARPDIAARDEILTENARARLRAPGTQVVELADFGQGACAYVFQNVEQIPRWYAPLAEIFAVEPVKNKSSCAVVLFQQSDRIFAATFGHGWMFLDADRLESDFGLRVAINALDDKKLKRLERSNLGDALKGVTLSSFRRGFETFGIDEALDLVRKISGSTKGDAPGDSITGSKALTISGDFTLTQLPELAEDALALMQSIAYRDTPFKVIDVVTPVTSSVEVTELDEVAATSIRERRGEFELGLPSEYLDEEVAFKFKGVNLRGSYPNLTMENYQAALGDDLEHLEVDRMRKDRVVAVFDDNDRPDRAWSIKSALVGSVAHRGGRYAINDNEWYRLDEAFKNTIDRNFDEVQERWDVAPTPLRTLVNEVGDDSRYQTEESYNRETADRLGYCLLDSNLVAIPDIQRSEFEVCDLLDIEGKRLIHVKKSSRRSNVLSHFFKQGGNSALQLKSFPTAWETTLGIVNAEYGAQRSAALQAALDDRARPWKIEFHIADTPRADGTFRIPFFSRITLRDEVQRLRAMEYGVGMRFIPMAVPAIARRPRE